MKIYNLGVAGGKQDTEEDKDENEDHFVCVVSEGKRELCGWEGGSK